MLVQVKNTSFRLSSSNSARTTSIQSRTGSAPYNKKKKSLLQSLTKRGQSLLFTKSPTPAMESSVETFFDGQLPRQRTVRKRILSCYGACSEGTSINGLWRKFLLAVFGIQDDEVWTRRVGSAVIHPDSKFARGKQRRKREKKGLMRRVGAGGGGADGEG